MATGGSPTPNPKTDTFPADIGFRKPWRSYQQRVLTELEQHLDDRHLHIIAAPGSGKTVLGLEVMRRLNRPTLILAPTVAIRDHRARGQAHRRGRTKGYQLAEHFRKMWAWYVGPTQLVYTRTPEGRSFLLRARTHTMSQRFQRQAERLRSRQ